MLDHREQLFPKATQEERDANLKEIYEYFLHHYEFLLTYKNEKFKHNVSHQLERAQRMHKLVDTRYDKLGVWK